MGGLKKGDIFNCIKFYKNINVYIYGSDRKIFYNLLRNKIKPKHQLLRAKFKIYT